MRVNSVKNNNPNFKGCLNNKLLLKGLEKISDHGASFAAGVSFLSAMTLRPLAITLAPKTDRENKKYASANSIASGIMKLAITEAIAIPVEKAISKINKTPASYLKKETMENLKDGASDLIKSKNYRFATQNIKLGAGFISAIPKSLLTVALIPVVMDKIISRKNPKNNSDIAFQKYDRVFEPVCGNLAFKGGIIDKTAKGIGKILDNKKVQDFAKKMSKNDFNVARNMTVGTDVLLSATTALRIKSSKKIEKERKNPLIYNNLISTGASILFGYSLDKAVQKSGEGFLKKFSEINKNDPKLLKYIEGINILRPTLIFAFVYYGILPVISTFVSDKIDKNLNKSQKIKSAQT